VTGPGDGSRDGHRDSWPGNGPETVAEAAVTEAASRRRSQKWIEKMSVHATSFAVSFVERFLAAGRCASRAWSKAEAVETKFSPPLQRLWRRLLWPPTVHGSRGLSYGELREGPGDDLRERRVRIRLLDGPENGTRDRSGDRPRDRFNDVPRVGPRVGTSVGTRGGPGGPFGSFKGTFLAVASQDGLAWHLFRRCRPLNRREAAHMGCDIASHTADPCSHGARGSSSPACPEEVVERTTRPLVRGPFFKGLRKEPYVLQGQSQGTKRVSDPTRSLGRRIIM